MGRIHLTGSLLLVALWLMLGADAALAGKAVCGDGICKGNEPNTCPQDCSSEPPPEECGDNICEGDETCSSCEADCGVCPAPSCNNDGFCNFDEDCLGCSDCNGRTSGKPSNRFCCGDDACDEARCGMYACQAAPLCGNFILEFPEECDDGNLIPGDGCDEFCVSEPISEPIPVNQFNIGDSIGEAEAANGTIGAANHDKVWSTGYGAGDGVFSLNERFDAEDPAYTANSSSLDPYFNQAISGSEMVDFQAQAQAVVAASASVPSGQVGMVTMLMGANDVCASSLAAMTDPLLFEQQYRDGLDVLAAAPVPQNVNLLVTSLPAIYWLWESKRTSLYCRLLAWPFVPCQNLLSDAADDCASATSRQDPDVVYAGDGQACQRRKAFHALIRDTYNPILEGVLAEYQSNNLLLNADYVDVFDIRFSDVHVNGGDCFHPSTAGHTLMSDEVWCRSRWGALDPGCAP